MSASSSVVADLFAAPGDEGRHAYLRRQGLADQDGLSWLLDLAEELVHDEPAAADELSMLCETAAEWVAVDAVAARARYLRARVHAERGELRRALELIDQARASWCAAGLPVSALRTDLGRMQILDDLGRHSEAVQLGIRLVAELDQLPDDTPERDVQKYVRAGAQENLGVAHGFLGQHARALEAYARAEATYRALGMRQELVRPMCNRGVELLEVGRAREALEVLQTAAAALAEQGDRLWGAKCAGDIAQAHQQLGQLFDALQVLEPARVTLDELDAQAEAARLQIAIAETYLALGLFTEASAEAAAAADRTISAGMTHDTAIAKFTVAVSHLAAGELDQAGTQLQAATALFDQVGDRHHQARARLVGAELAAAQGRRAEAAALADVAAAALRAGGWLAPLAWARLQQADLAADDAAATAHLDRAAVLIGRLRLPQLGYPYALRRGRLHRRLGRHLEAEDEFRQAIDAVEQLGGRLPDPGLRMAFRADKLAAHDELIDILAVRGDDNSLQEACRISDQAKAQTLTGLIAGTLGPRSPQQGTGAEVQLNNRRIDLDVTYGALLTAGAGQRAQLRRRATLLEHEVERLRLRAAAADGAGRSTAADLVTVPAGGWPAGSALAYHLLGEDVIAFSLHDGELITATRIPGAVPAVHAQLDQLSAQWSRFRIGSAFTGRHQATLVRTTQMILGELYQLLLAPVLGLNDSDELLIVPHRQLHQVPFHALHDGHRYVLEGRAVTIAPLLTGGPAPRYRGIDEGVLVLAAPDAHTPSVTREAHALARLLPDARILVGDTATSRELTAGLPGPGVVHIACHGLYRADNPLFSALRLADRWITAAEISELDFSGALVTLSACESGRPGRGTAEPVGLAWALLAAGAGGVVVSQWVVHDEATVGLMGEFYHQLTNGLRPALALRQAQLATASEHPHPFYWAPFSYVTASTANAPPGDRHVEP